MINPRLKVAGVWLVGLAMVCRSAHAQTSQPTTDYKWIDSAAAATLKTTGVPSASIAVAQGGKITYLQAYGSARLAPPLAAQPGQQYSIGSISKQFAAAMALLLVQDGKLRLDDPVGKYLPELTQADKVTVRQVLSMTSGYQDFWPEDYVMTSLMKPTTPAEILTGWAKKPLDFDPGTSWQYSNTNYVILGRIIEIAGGKPLFDQLQERIFKPLKMTGVIDSDANPLPTNDLTGYYCHALGPPRPAPPSGPGWMFGAGELAMPASDLMLWNISLMNKTLLAPASYKEMFTSAKMKDGSDTSYGFGIAIGNIAGHRFLTHDGEVSGFEADSIVFPDDKIAVVVLTNQDNASADDDLAWTIAMKLVGMRPPSTRPHVPQPRVVETPAAKRVHAIFVQLQQGKPDRAEFTPFCNSYFSDEAIEDFSSSLKPLGKPGYFKQTSDSLRGGMINREFQLEISGKHLGISTFEEPDGKLEQYMIRVAGE